MVWLSPLPELQLVPTTDSESFRYFYDGATGIPHGTTHPGAFGFQRKNHIHEGVDLYCEDGTSVHAVESGIVTAIEPFTGPSANPPSPWWHDTYSVMIEGNSGAILYGEIYVAVGIEVGHEVQAGDWLGEVVQVLKTDKGRPMSMLHMELHVPGTIEAKEWVDTRPETLLDPTPFLLEIIS